jgi:hypothetical protein
MSPIIPLALLATVMYALLLFNTISVQLATAAHLERCFPRLRRAITPCAFCECHFELKLYGYVDKEVDIGSAVGRCCLVERCVMREKIFAEMKTETIACNQVNNDILVLNDSLLPSLRRSKCNKTRAFGETFVSLLS